MITLPNGIEVHMFAGASFMSDTIDTDALVNATTHFQYRAVTVGADANGLKANTDIFLASLNNAEYRTNVMRRVLAVATNTLTLSLGRMETYTAATPAGSEAWCAGYTSTDPYFFLGFKMHLSAADTNGETLTLAIDANEGAYWDTKIYSKVMTGVTDIIYFPEVKIPMLARDILKFSWTNTGGKTWGVELWTQKRV